MMYDDLDFVRLNDSVSCTVLDGHVLLRLKVFLEGGEYIDLTQTLPEIVNGGLINLFQDSESESRKLFEDACREYGDTLIVMARGFSLAASLAMRFYEHGGDIAAEAFHHQVEGTYATMLALEKALEKKAQNAPFIERHEHIKPEPRCGPAVEGRGSLKDYDVNLGAIVRQLDVPKFSREED